MRLALIAAACVAIAAPIPASAAADVRVVGGDGREYTFDLDQHAGDEDVTDVPYAIRTSPSEQTTRRITGFSVARVLELAEGEVPGDRFDHFYFDHVEIQRPTGGRVMLTNAQVRSPVDPARPPVIYASGDQVAFLRPSRGSDDPNAGDSFSTDGELRIEQGESSLDATIEAAPRRPKVGEEVTLTARIEGRLEGQVLEYRWTFGRGLPSKSGDATEVGYAYPSPDCYRATLTVREHGERRATAAVYVLVETPRRECERPGDGGGREQRPKPNPDGDGGGNGGGEGSGDRSGSGSRDPASSEPHNDRDRARPASGQLDPVTGKLLDDPGGGERLGGSSVETVAPPPASPDPLADDSDRGAGIPGVAVVLLAAVGLLGIGALRELERLAPAGIATPAAGRLGSAAGWLRSLVSRPWR